MTPARIRTERLTKRFAGVEAIQDVSFDVPEGSVFALVGPNGAGKTTTIKTLMNILRPASGRAEVLGTDSRALGPAQLARIGYVSENQQLPDWMQVGYFLSFCKRFYPRWDDGIAGDLIRLYELPLDRKLANLSRGMRIKAALASSLAYAPSLIVLDEPFGGLDPLVREQLIESVLDRTPEATVFLASHDLAEIESFASHIAWLDQGRLRFVEETAALLDRFREIEVTLSECADPPPGLPSAWLGVERASAVVRFVDSRYQRERSEAEIARCFPSAAGISARGMPLRSIFVALAKAEKRVGSAE